MTTIGSSIASSTAAQGQRPARLHDVPVGGSPGFKVDPSIITKPVSGWMNLAVFGVAGGVGGSIIGSMLLRGGSLPKTMIPAAIGVAIGVAGGALITAQAQSKYRAALAQDLLHHPAASAPPQAPAASGVDRRPDRSDPRVGRPAVSFTTSTYDQRGTRTQSTVDIGLDTHLGRRDGYSTLGDALLDRPAGTSTILRIDDRFHLYGSTDVGVPDESVPSRIKPAGSNVAAFAIGERIWTSGAGGLHELSAGDAATHPLDPSRTASSSAPDDWGTYETDHGYRGGRNEASPVTNGIGYGVAADRPGTFPTLGDAATVMRAEAGDQAVRREANGRFSVQESYWAGGGMTRTVPEDLAAMSQNGVGLNGIRVADDKLVAMELDGVEFAPKDGWLVRSAPPAG